MRSCYTVSKHARKDRKNTKSWKVEASGPNKTRIRKFFPSRALALQYAKDLNDKIQASGWGAKRLTKAQQDEAAICYELLASTGKSLKSVVEFFLSHQNETKNEITFHDVVIEILEAKSHLNLSIEHRRTMKHHFNSFNMKFGHRKLSSVSRTEIQAWLHSRKLPSTTFKSVRAHVVMIFNYCMKEGHLTKNLASDIALPKTKVSSLGILRVGALQNLLRITRESSKELLPAIAVQAYAGLRRGEVCRLDWREIKQTSGLIEVTARKSKTAMRRLVEIPPPLAAILAAMKKPSGPVAPKSYSRASATLRKNLIKSGFLWPKNGLRHSYASYHLALHQDAAKTALELGHKSTSMLFEHYRELVTKEDAAAWFKGELQPTPTPSNRPKTPTPAQHP